MEILYIHTCRSSGILRTIRKKFKYKITGFNNPWNYLEQCENIIKNNMAADIYVLELSSMKYIKGADNFNRTEYENYLRGIIEYINKKPVFLLFNLNPIISPEHITPLIKSKLNNNNRIKSRDWSEKWTKQIFQKYHSGKFTALTGDDIFGKYNESKYIMKSRARSEVTPRDTKYEEHAFSNMLDTRHYTKQYFDFLENGKLTRPKQHAGTVISKHLKDFLKQL